MVKSQSSSTYERIISTLTTIGEQLATDSGLTPWEEDCTSKASENSLRRQCLRVENLLITDNYSLKYNVNSYKSKKILPTNLRTVSIIPTSANQSLVAPVSGKTQQSVKRTHPP